MAEERAPEEKRYFDRELSWLDFNRRVLAEARDETNPLMERIKFIGIVSSNFDEFFMVRMAGFSEMDSQALELYKHAFDLLGERNDYFTSALVPEMAKAGITRILPQALSDKQTEYLRGLFQKELLPLLTPIALREEHPVPVLGNLGLYRLVELHDPAQAAEIFHYAVIEMPKNYARLISLPAEQGYSFILIEDVVSLFLKEIFTGYEIVDQGVFRVTRAADLTLDEEKDEDFAKVMTEALRLRRMSRIVRLEIACSERMLQFLKTKLQVADYRIFRNQGWLALRTLAQLVHQPMFEHLRRPAWNARPAPEFEQAEDVWALIREKDRLLHHPYQSFDTVVRFIAAAAADPDVLAIKQTLYRTDRNSMVIKALETAAEKGKQVTVLIELKARFDEERNIEWARRLENAGANVLYGVAGLKTHAKVCLVVRREVDGIRRYAHLSTGNYNEKTAELYSDLGFLTAHDAMTADLSQFFNVITGFSHPVGFSKIEIAPHGLRRRLTRLILREGMRSQKQKPGLIMAKLNSLVDKEIIEALYRASQQGVEIKLNVRGICCLRPGVPGLSENIEVTSVVDTFLEHSRIFYFSNAGEEEVYLSSADWMPRNLDRRLEVLFPIEDPKLKAETAEMLKLYFKDNQKAWSLEADGSYRKKMPGSEKPFRVQEFLCRKAEESQSQAKTIALKDITPQKPKNP